MLANREENYNPWHITEWRSEFFADRDAPMNVVIQLRLHITVLCITVGGSRNGPPPTTNSPPKSEASSANSTSVRTNRFFDFWTLLALYIYRSRI